MNMLKCVLSYLRFTDPVYLKVKLNMLKAPELSRQTFNATHSVERGSSLYYLGRPFFSLDCVVLTYLLLPFSCC